MSPAPQSILIVKLSSLGDVLHTLPAARHLRQCYPHAKLAWAVEEAYADVLRGQPWLDDLVLWRRWTFGTYLDFLWRLRRTKWDVAVDFQGIFRSAALVVRCSGARRRVGYAPSPELAHWCYNETVPMPARDCHAVERYLKLAEAVSGRAAEPPLDRPYLSPPHSPAPLPSTVPPQPLIASPRFPLYPKLADHQAVDGWLRERRFAPPAERLVLLCPDARRMANRWPEAHFAQLATKLLAIDGVRVALLGGPAATDICNRIAAATTGGLWRADGRFRLPGSAVLLSRAAAVVTGDTGAMHLAVAVGAPVVALIGPTNPRLTGPYAVDAVVLTRALTCSPCKTSGRCPLGHAVPPCMAELSVEDAFQAVCQLLQRNAHAPLDQAA